MAGLYIHVPFCVRKCRYCDFYSLPSTQEVRERYAQKLCGMLKTSPFPGQEFQTVYFGGGTPALIGADQIAEVLQAVREGRQLSPDAEITVELNPESTTRELLEALRAAGVTRLSFGVQSADAEQLRLLGRGHTVLEAQKALRKARLAGFGNLSADIMMGIPRESRQTLTEALRFCLENGADHVSLYMLKVETGTPFDSPELRALCPDPDETADRYLYALDLLQEWGYRQYEISNFAVPGYESRHNLGYWTLEPYLGIGPAAHSLIGGRRFYFPRNLNAFLDSTDPWDLRIDDGEGATFEETVMLRLRLCEGLNLSWAAERFGAPALKLRKKASALGKAGYSRLFTDSCGEEWLSLTPEGFLVQNAVLAELL